MLCVCQVCNNLGQCHCDVGYAPPYCDRPGNGGSEHSGPVAVLQGDYLDHAVIRCRSGRTIATF